MAYSQQGVMALGALCALMTTLSVAKAELVVAAGRSVSLMTLSSIDPTCHALGPVTVNVIEQPRGGFIQVSQTKDFPSFNTLNSRVRCNTLKLPATRVTYQSAGNFLGLDFVTIEAIYPEGAVKRIRVAISVRPIAPPPAPPVLQGRVDVPEEQLTGPEPLPLAPKPKRRVHHAEARPRAAEQHGCKTSCIVPGKSPIPSVVKPAEPRPLLTPI